MSTPARHASSALRSSRKPISSVDSWYKATSRNSLRKLSQREAIQTNWHTNRARSLHTSQPLSNAGPRKLTNILEGGPAPAVQVRRIAPEGIELADGLILPGACVFLDGKVFLWDVGSDAAGTSVKWEKDMFKLFEVVIPKPEILLLGTGKGVIHLPQGIRLHLNDLGIQLDVMDTWNACTTYNLLAEEGRRVAAALLPVSGAPWKRNA